MDDDLKREAIYSVADLVSQFAYRTKFRNYEALCDGGLSALENAFWVLELSGCKINSNGTITEKNIFKFMDSIKK